MQLQIITKWRDNTKLFIAAISLFTIIQTVSSCKSVDAAYESNMLSSTLTNYANNHFKSELADRQITTIECISDGVKNRCEIFEANGKQYGYSFPSNRRLAFYRTINITTTTEISVQVTMIASAEMQDLDVYTQDFNYGLNDILSTFDQMKNEEQHRYPPKRSRGIREIEIPGLQINIRGANDRI